MKMPIAIPIKKHLVSFLIVEFGPSPEITARCPIGRIIFTYLRVKEKNTLPKPTADQLFYTVHIPYRYFIQNKLSTISEAGVWEMNEWFDRYFTCLLITWVNARISLKEKDVIAKILADSNKKSAIQINEAIIDFLKKYNISEGDMSFETAKRRYTRSTNNSKQLLL